MLFLLALELVGVIGLTINAVIEDEFRKLIGLVPHPAIAGLTSSGAVEKDNGEEGRSDDLIETNSASAIERGLEIKGVFPFQSVNSRLDPNLVWYDQFDRYGTPRGRPLKTPEDYFIFLLGGSTVEGDGAPTEKETIGFQLQHLLRKELASACGKKVTVINEGISGYSSKQELLLFLLKILPFQKPDMVIVLDGVNDFIAFTGERNTGRWLYDTSWTTSELRHMGGEVEFRNMSLKKSLAHTSHLIMLRLLDKTYVGQFIDAMFARYAGVPYSAFSNPYLRGKNLDLFPEIHSRSANYQFNIDSIDSLAHGHGVKVFWFLQPILSKKLQLVGAEREFYEGRIRNSTALSEASSGLQFDPKRFWPQLNHFYRLASQKMLTKDNRFDLSTLFQESSDQDFDDFVHYTPIGQKKIAKEILRRIKSAVDCQ